MYETSHRTLSKIFLITIITVGILFPIGLFTAPVPPKVEKLVMANLYNWYGTPEGLAGQYAYKTVQRRSDLTHWDVNTSTMQLVNESINNDTGAYEVRGVCISAATNQLTTNFTMPGDLFRQMKNGVWLRTYFKINYTLDNPNAESVQFFIRQGNTTYVTDLPISTTFQVVRKTFPFDFSNYTDIGIRSMYLKVIASAAGHGQEHGLQVESVNVSSWAHYNEDYHTYYNPDGNWYNDPPFTKATDKNVYFPGNISDALGPIPAYGTYFHLWNESTGRVMNQSVVPGGPFYGIYDSLNATVIEAQLRLMYYAGVDVVMIMHPWAWDVAEAILDVAWDIRQRFELIGQTFNLRFAYYGGWENPDSNNPSSGISYIIDQITAYTHDEIILKVDEKPVYFCGPTGMLEEPYAVYLRDLGYIRRTRDVFLVMDGYIPPKEEMLDLQLFDGYYFYDTSGMYRNGYGSPVIPVAQKDGIWFHGQGGISTLFCAAATISHAHGLIYASTVIPGTDNTCVHNFTGTPLYDGRPSDIVERVGGFTFNETWQASLDAGADWITITSWNELHEGTEIEPTLENGTFYVQLCQTLSQKYHETG